MLGKSPLEDLNKIGLPNIRISADLESARYNWFRNRLCEGLKALECLRDIGRRLSVKGEQQMRLHRRVGVLTPQVRDF
jgi:hypothetical protein